MLTSVEHHVYLAAFITSIAAALVAPISVFCVYRGLKQFHQNMRYISLYLSFLWCVYPIFNGIYSFHVIYYEELDSQSLVNQVPKFISYAIYYSFHFLSFSLCAERLVATVCYKTYESKKKFNLLFPIIFMLSLTLSVGYSLFYTECSFCMNIDRFTAFVVLFAVSIFPIDFLVIVATVHISKQNRRRQKIRNSLTVTLSDRYQTAENLRYLQVLIPTAYLTTCCIFLGVLGLILSMCYSYTIVIPTCLTKTNLYVVIMTGMWYFEVCVCKNRRPFNYKRSTSVLPSTPNGPGEDHFTMLKTMWK